MVTDIDMDMDMEMDMDTDMDMNMDSGHRIMVKNTKSEFRHKVCLRRLKSDIGGSYAHSDILYQQYRTEWAYDLSAEKYISG
jgi:hypothetical protein